MLVLFDCRRSTAVGRGVFFVPAMGSIFHSLVLFSDDVAAVGQSVSVWLDRGLVEGRMRRQECRAECACVFGTERRRLELKRI